MNDAVMKLMTSRSGFELWTEGLDAAIKRSRADYL
jgi:hypothetical protein